MPGLTVEDINKYGGPGAIKHPEAMKEIGAVYQNFNKLSMTDPSNPLNGAYLWAMRNMYVEKVLLPEKMAAEQAAGPKDEGMGVPGMAGAVAGAVASQMNSGDPHMPNFDELANEANRASAHNKFAAITPTFAGAANEQQGLAEMEGYSDRAQEEFEKCLEQGVSFTDARDAVDNRLVEGLANQFDAVKGSMQKPFDLYKSAESNQPGKKEEDQEQDQQRSSKRDSAMRPSPPGTR